MYPKSSSPLHTTGMQQDNYFNPRWDAVEFRMSVRSREMMQSQLKEGTNTGKYFKPKRVMSYLLKVTII